MVAGGFPAGGPASPRGGTSPAGTDPGPGLSTLDPPPWPHPEGGHHDRLVRRGLEDGRDAFDFYVRFAQDQWAAMTPAKYVALLVTISLAGVVMMGRDRKR